MRIVAAALSVGAGACAPVHVRYDTWAEAPPPAPYVEVVHPAPTATHVWVDGYWWWDGVNYVWVRGHWQTPPRVGYVWAPAGWVWVDGRYQFFHGRWMQPSRRVQIRYVHPRPAVRVQPGARYRTVRPRGSVRVRGRGSVQVR